MHTCEYSAKIDPLADAWQLQINNYKCHFQWIVSRLPPLRDECNTVRHQKKILYYPLLCSSGSFNVNVCTAYVWFTKMPFSKDCEQIAAPAWWVQHSMTSKSILYYPLLCLSGSFNVNACTAYAWFTKMPFSKDCRQIAACVWWAQDSTTSKNLRE